MKIKVGGEKIIKAVSKLEGIEIILENPEDAREAIDLVLKKSGLSDQEAYGRLREVKVTALQEYKTSAVDYRMAFLLEFLFEEDTPAGTKVEVIKALQEFFDRV